MLYYSQVYNIKHHIIKTKTKNSAHYEKFNINYIYTYLKIKYSITYTNYKIRNKDFNEYDIHILLIITKYNTVIKNMNKKLSNNLSDITIVEDLPQQLAESKSSFSQTQEP